MPQHVQRLDHSTRKCHKPSCLTVHTSNNRFLFLRSFVSQVLSQPAWLTPICSLAAPQELRSVTVSPQIDCCFPDSVHPLTSVFTRLSFPKQRLKAQRETDYKSQSFFPFFWKQTRCLRLKDAVRDWSSSLQIRSWCLTVSRMWYVIGATRLQIRSFSLSMTDYTSQQVFFLWRVRFLLASSLSTSSAPTNGLRHSKVLVTVAIPSPPPASLLCLLPLPSPHSL